MQASASGPEGMPPPPLPAGAMFFQKIEWRVWPPTWNENSFRVAFMSRSAPPFRAASSFSRIAFAPTT